MSDVYRIFGAELSPFSVKIRSFFRYKQIPHRWIVRNSETMADYQKYAKIPIVPLVVTPDEQGIQDSTPIMEAMEELFPESAYQLTHNALFPHNCMHIENLGGEIALPELQNQRLQLGCFPWKFKGGEAAFARVVAFLDL